MKPKTDALSVEQAKAVLDYDPNTGTFTWRVNRGRGVRAGDKAGTVNRHNRCLYLTIDGQRHLAHRVAWMMHYGVVPMENVSAKNGNYLDLQIKNFVLKTAAETSRSKTGAKGVSLSKGKWRAEITRNYEKIYLGTYDTEEDAVKAYRAAVDAEDPRTVRPQSKPYRIKTADRRKYWLIHSAWKRTMKENNNVVGWDTVERFAEDVERFLFPHCRVVSRSIEEPVGPGNFVVERMSKFDRKTPEGRIAYYKYKNSERKHERKNHSLNRSFGISIDEYNRMREEQKGVCAICGEPETHSYKGDVRSLSVDHCHASGIVRQLLCHSCNHGLGCFRDNPEFLEEAAAYIRKHNARKHTSVPASNVISIKAKER